jgi:hypothetical protein
VYKGGWKPWISGLDGGKEGVFMREARRKNGGNSWIFLGVANVGERERCALRM